MRKKQIALLAAFVIACQTMGCSVSNGTQTVPESATSSMRIQVSSDTASAPNTGEDLKIMEPTDEIVALAQGFSMVRHEGDYGFDAFLSAGGASTDEQVVQYLLQNGLQGAGDFSLQAGGFGCSTLSVKSPSGTMLFGRNFDWEPCNALVVSAKPQHGYASLSTVNMDFLEGDLGILPDNAKTLAALYAPLDGINEKGLTAAVLMIEDSATIEQNTEKPDITTTTAIRLLLDSAATVDEALALLRQYDMHASMGMMVHFALADPQGKSVVVEYINNEMTVIQTSAVTNFYLAQGEKNGIGTNQSHIRYDLLLQRLVETPVMDVAAVRDTMKSVSKQNFGEFESTEWSTVYDQSKGFAHYYHRENYEKVYTFAVT